VRQNLIVDVGDGTVVGTPRSPDVGFPLFAMSQPNHVASAVACGSSLPARVPDPGHNRSHRPIAILVGIGHDVGLVWMSHETNMKKRRSPGPAA